MRRRTKKQSYTYLALYVFALLICITILIHIHTRYEIHFFSDALRKTHSDETVSIAGTSYEVKNGVVLLGGAVIGSKQSLDPLRLAYEKTVARRSPLLALPEVDPSDMRTAVDDLQKTADRLAALQASSADATLLRTSLYPIGFLYAVTDLEQARLAFLVSGSNTDALRYEAAMRSAFSSYQKDSAEFAQGFQKAVPSDIGSYATEKNIIQRSAVLAAVDALRSGMSHMQDLSEKRLSCIHGDTRTCDLSDLTLPVFASSPRTVAPGSVGIARRVSSLYAQSGLRLKSDAMIALSQDVCANEQSGTAALFTVQLPATSSPRVLLIGDIHLIPSDQYATLPFYSYFNERDVSYVLVNPLTYYECIQTDESQGAFWATLDVAAFATSSKLNTWATGDAANSLRELEKRLGSGLITQADAAAYLTEAQDLAAQKELPKQTVDKIASLTLETTDLSQGLYRTILDINLYENMNMNISAEGVRIDFSPLYYFFTRSAFADLLMEGNRSATGDHAPLFQSNNLSADVQPFVYYSNLPQTSAVRDALIRDIRFFYTLHSTTSQ